MQKTIIYAKKKKSFRLIFGTCDRKKHKPRVGTPFSGFCNVDNHKKVEKMTTLLYQKFRLFGLWTLSLRSRDSKKGPIFRFA